MKLDAPKVIVDESILFWAFRYCLGRRTYAVSDCVNNILSVWQVLTPKTKQLMCDEITDAIQKGAAGMDMDVSEWQKIVDYYEAELKK